MKSMRIIVLIIGVLVLLVRSLSAAELNNVYKLLGNYRVSSVKGLKVYFPESTTEAIPRIIANLQKVREQFNKRFPEQSNYEVKLILTDHNDRNNSSTDLDFDLINLDMFEEIGALSTRAYSIEKRFALSLSNIFLLRMLASASNSWKRKLGTLAVPQWYLDGLTLHNAFSLDSIHYSRLLDMARSKRLYDLKRLNTILSQPTLIKEEMRIQAHSMLAYWDKTYRENAGLELMRQIVKRPGHFNQIFKNVYGVSLNEAFDSFKEYLSRHCSEIKNKLSCADLKIDEQEIGGKFFRSFRKLSSDEEVWVSSRRYSTETYDLYYRKKGQKPKILAKNVHPLLLVDEFSRQIVFARYWVNNKKQLRLALYQTTPEGTKRCLVNEPGSFKPLGKKFGRIFYTSIKSGITRVMSVDPEFKNSTRVEFIFPSSVHPLDLALDKACRELFYVFETPDFKKCLAVVSIRNDDKAFEPRQIFISDGDIRALSFAENRLWFAAETDSFTTQLISFDNVTKTFYKHSALPGGVWDCSIKNGTIQVVTLVNGGFWATTLNSSEKIAQLPDQPQLIKIKTLSPVKSSSYKSEYQMSYWKPIITEDEDGSVFGIYNYRTDKLDRSNIVIVPRYGFKSKNWGYEGAYTHRFGLFKVCASIVDEVKKKSYLGNEYFERNRSKVLDIEYPFSFSTTLSVGVDLTKRGIAKIPVNGNPFPTVGRDHSLYANVNYFAIRTEPYWEIFPRKGRKVTAYYKRGNNILDGELNYDSMGLRWNEYLPINNAWVLTGRAWIAEDDKENNIRRPDDLSLGGYDYLRAFDFGFISGDSLRAFSLHLGRPVKLLFPNFMSWIYNEFLAVQVFAEMADVRSTGQKFRFFYDRGIELYMQTLLFKRIPMRFHLGYAIQNGGKESNTFFVVDVTDYSVIF